MIIDPVVYSSRPSEKRSPEEEKCYDFLEELGVPFTRVDHEHADTIEACLEVEKILGCEICKNLLLTNRQMTDLYLLLMPGNKPFRTKFLSKQLGCARLSFVGLLVGFLVGRFFLFLFLFHGLFLALGCLLLVGIFTLFRHLLFVFAFEIFEVILE